MAIDQGDEVVALGPADSFRASGGEHLLSSKEDVELGVTDEVSQRCSGVVAVDHGDAAGTFDICT